jgi:prepilin-type N-terminal cleavage/methylation domain-containing protein
MIGFKMTDKKTRGFTLIELMIVILIAGLLMLVAAPFTRAWTASAKITEAQGVLNQAVSRAKAVALRNPNGLARVDDSDNIQVAAAVCGASGNVNVWVATDVDTPASCDTAGTSQGTQIWTHKLPNNVTVETMAGTTASTFTGLCFDNRGLVIDSCGSKGLLNIKVEDVDNEIIQFY